MLKNPQFHPRPRRRRRTLSNYDDRHHDGFHWFGWVLVAFLLVAVLAFAGSLETRGFYGMMPMYNGYPYFGWFFFPFGFIFFFIFVFFIARMIFWGFGGWGWKRRHWYGHGYGRGDVREILRERYARGEITKEQYDQMMKDLELH